MGNGIKALMSVFDRSPHLQTNDNMLVLSSINIEPSNNRFTSRWYCSDQLLWISKLMVMWPFLSQHALIFLINLSQFISLMMVTYSNWIFHQFKFVAHARHTCSLKWNSNITRGKSIKVIAPQLGQTYLNFSLLHFSSFSCLSFICFLIHFVNVVLNKFLRGDS